MARKRNRYREMEQFMTYFLIGDGVVFLLFLLASAFGVTWLKVITALLCLGVSALGIGYLYLSGELLRPRSRWMSIGFAAVLLCLLVALGPFRAAARTAVILRAVLLGALGAVIVCSLSNMDPARLVPVGWSDAPRVLLGALPLASVCAVAGCFSFLAGYVRPPDDGWRLGRTIGLLLALGAVVCGSVVSVFGPALTATLTYPFFVMIRSISLWDLVPRVEAVVIAVWVGADFFLGTMLLRCAHEALRPVFGLPSPDEADGAGGGRWLFWPEAAALFGCSHLFDLPPWQLRLWSDRYIPLMSDCVLYGGFTLLWLATIPQRKKEKSRG